MRKRQTIDIASVSATLGAITSQVGDASADVQLMEDLDDAVRNARDIRKNARTLVKQAEKLVSAILQQKNHVSRRGRGRGREDFGWQRDWALEYSYHGVIKFGAARMWQDLVPSIQEAMKDFGKHKELGSFKVRIEEDIMRNIDAKKISNSIVDALEDCQSEAVQLSALPKRHRLHGLACNVSIVEEQSSDFSVPRLDVDFDELGKADCRDLFCFTVKEGSSCCTKPYLVVPADSSSQWRESVGLAATTYLHCGERLNMTNSRLPGVHTTYEYFSAGPGSCTAMHVEDGFLGSINFVLAGAPKVWLFVQPSFRRKLETKVRENFVGKRKTLSCSQFVRHLNKLFSPELLDSWEIPYYIVPCKAGEMIITLPGTYHQVINAGANYAQAINFAVERDWTGPPEEYEFCTVDCTLDVEPVTAAQLRIREDTLGSNSGSGRDGRERSSDETSTTSDDSDNLDDSTSSQTTDSNMSQLPKDVEEFIDETIRSGTTNRQEPTPQWPNFPPTPGGPASDTQISRESTPTGQGSHRADPEALPHMNDLLDGDKSGEGRKPSLIDPEGTLDLARANDGDEVDAEEGPPFKDSTAGIGWETSSAPGNATPTRGDESQSAFGEGGPEASIQITDESDNISSNVVELSLDPTISDNHADSSIEARIDLLVKKAASFLPALKVSMHTLYCFRPRQKLNNEAILETLETILPDKASPLIATFAIKNFPSSGLAVDFTGAGIQPGMQPQLLHDVDSTHLFVAYNVDAQTLQYSADVPGNHWVLIAVDLPSKKVHFFGAETGLETQGLTIARNVSTFINAFRIAEGYQQVDWADISIHPLYPTEEFPDDYNCGVAAISRAETFIYPDKAPKLPDRTTPSELNKHLDELRAIYLDCIVRRYSRVCDDEVASAQLGVRTPIQKGRKRTSPFPEPDGKKVLVAKSAFKRRLIDSSPVLEMIPRPETEKWKECILRSAQSSGFDGVSLVETFENVPKNALEKALRLLQCVCEVANRDRLFQLKAVLKLGMQPFLEQCPSVKDLERLADLHFSINRFAQATYMAQYQRYMSLALYYQWFQSEVRERSNYMKKARMERVNMAYFVRNGCQNRLGPPPTHTNDMLAPGGEMSKSRQALAQVKDDLVKILVETGKDSETARKELDRNIREGKVLNLLLSPLDNRYPRTDIRFLCLFPLYEPLHDPLAARPSLDLMVHGPPEEMKKLKKPITGQELLNFNESLSEFFGRNLFKMRPELARIDVNSLPGANTARLERKLISSSEEEMQGPDTIYLGLALDEELRQARPKDTARFFEPAESVSTLPRQLEFR